MTKFPDVDPWKQTPTAPSSVAQDGRAYMEGARKPRQYPTGRELALFWPLAPLVACCIVWSAWFDAIGGKR